MGSFRCSPLRVSQRLRALCGQAGTGAGVIAAYQYGKGLVDRAAYTVVGTGVGLVVDRYLFPEE